MDEAKLELGKRTRSEVLGAESTLTGAADPGGVLAAVRDLGLEFAWGSIWARKGLPIRERRLVSIALLASQDRGRELEMHIRAALAHDCTVEEIQEVCIHLICYCGFPAATDALRALSSIAATPGVMGDSTPE